MSAAVAALADLHATGSSHGRSRSRRPRPRPCTCGRSVACAAAWPLRRTLCFLGGIGCALVALQSGIDAYDDQLLSVHMVQHMLLLMVVPALLLGGQPVLLALRALPPRRRRGLARALQRVRPYLGPAPSLAFFSAVVVLTHLSSFYDATLRHAALHDLEHALYVIAGLLIWWQILDVDPVPRTGWAGSGGSST